MDALAGSRIEGEGTREADWTRSRWLAALPETDADAWLRDVRRLVVVSPHPDDEVLGCGGLVFHARRAGIEVLVVSVTDGEACYPDHPAWTAARLRGVRRDELVRAVGRLGVAAGNVLALALDDGGVAEDAAALSAHLSGLLRAEDTVLTTWRRDGHPDHEAAARAARAAAAACGARLAEFPVWAWHWLDPSGEASRLPGAVRIALSPPARRAKAAALACFASQLGAVQPAPSRPILPPHVLERFARGFEVLVA